LKLGELKANTLRTPPARLAISSSSSRVKGCAKKSRSSALTPRSASLSRACLQVLHFAQ
jgi:hypothetical protein